MKLSQSLYEVSALVTALRRLVVSAGDGEDEDESSWTGLKGLCLLKVPAVNARTDAGLAAGMSLTASEMLPNWLILGHESRDLAGESAGGPIG